MGDAQVPWDYVWGNCDDQKVMGDMQVPQEYVWGNCDDQKVMGDAEDGFIGLICFSNDKIVLM